QHFDELPEPAEGACKFAGGVRSVSLLVQPMRGDAVLGYLMHLLRSDLDFGTFFLRPDYRCMYRAVAIRLRRRDIILETAGHHRPARVQRPERTIAIRYVVHDHAEPEYVGKLFQRNRAALHLPPHRIGPLLPPDHFAGKSAFL